MSSPSTPWCRFYFYIDDYGAGGGRTLGDHAAVGVCAPRLDPNRRAAKRSRRGPLAGAAPLLPQDAWDDTADDGGYPGVVFESEEEDTDQQAQGEDDTRNYCFDQARYEDDTHESCSD